ncbi:MAG: DUF393 domain-containing protein [Planctomycetes bacterium]|nr:DUF393 domain-containing protein [Planctomycetota bacterium]MCB9885677.1 DUF393 domain-containing protein [Planctomycetota bacterium]
MNPALPSAPVVLYDGVCGLCQGWVQWVLAHDRRAVFRFAALQSKVAAELLAAVGATGPLPDSLVLVDGGAVHTRSGAALRVFGRLGLPWSLARLGLLVPPLLRNWTYDWIARHRYRWFGKREQCLVPTPAQRGLFLDAPEG